MKSKIFLITNLIVFGFLILNKSNVKNLTDEVKWDLNNDCYSLTLKDNIKLKDPLIKSVFIQKDKNQLREIPNEYYKKEKYFINKLYRNVIVSESSVIINRKISCIGYKDYSKIVNLPKVGSCGSYKDPKTNERIYVKILGYGQDGAFSEYIYDQGYIDFFMRSLEAKSEVEYPINISKKIISSMDIVKCPEKYSLKFKEEDCIGSRWRITNINHEKGFYEVQSKVSLRGPGSFEKVKNFKVKRRGIGINEIYFYDQYKYERKRCN